MRTQGTPTKQTFDVDTSEFNVEFTVNTDVNAPSVAYLSSTYYYENGITYTIAAADGTALPTTSVSAEYKDNLLSFTISDSSYNGKTIKLMVNMK